MGVATASMESHEVMKVTSVEVVEASRFHVSFRHFHRSFQ